MDRHVELINLLSLLDYKSPSDHRFLAHHGVKGMRWGVRKSPAASRHKQSSKDVGSLKTVGKNLGSSTKRGVKSLISKYSVSRASKKERKNAEALAKKAANKKIKELSKATDSVKGSKHPKLSSDKMDMEINIKRGKNALSNIELKNVNQRLELEFKYDLMMSKRPTKKGSVKKVLDSAGQLYAFSQTPAGKMLVGVGKSYLSKKTPAKSSSKKNKNVKIPKFTGTNPNQYTTGNAYVSQFSTELVKVK